MQLSYEILFNVIFNHRYYASNSFTFFKPNLSRETKTFFYKYGLIFKPHTTGFIVLFENFFAGRQRTRKEILETPFMLRFFLVNDDPHFCTYTSNFSKYDPYYSVLYFNNNGEHLDRLHNAEFVDAALDQLTASEIVVADSFKKPFSIVDINLLHIRTATYFIRFEAKEIHWRYVLTTQHLQELENPAIIDKSNNFFFEGPASCLLPDGKKALLFTSRQSIILSEQPKRDIQLVENYNPGTGKYKVVISRLPNPDIRNFSVITTKIDTKEQIRYAEIII